MIRIWLAVAMLAVAGELGAQAAPPITAAKRAATNARDAANARTERQQTEPEAAVETAAASPAQSAPASRRGRQARSQRAAEASDTVRASNTGATARDSASASEMTLLRERFEYSGGGRRDPFVSLIGSGDLRPLLNDLRLVGVIYDPTGRRPIAVMRDMTTQEQYRVTTGQVIGRMRVAQIHPKSVTFTIEEFGFSRQETLTLGDPSTGARAQ